MISSHAHCANHDRLFKGEGSDEFKAMWAPGTVYLIFDKEGVETAVGVADELGEGVTMTWDTYQQLAAADFQKASYVKTEAECLGILGKRMILEVNRFNEAGEIYMTAVTLLTLNEEGLLVTCEAFGDPQIESVTEHA